MNCLEFRRVVQADPSSRDPAVLRHRQECAACAAVSARAAELEQQLQRALKVEVPEDLASRILLRQSFKPHHRRPWWRRAPLYAAAAGVILALALSAAFLVPPRGHPIEQGVLARMASEPYALTRTERVEDAQLVSILEQANLRLAGERALLGDITFAHLCVVNSKVAAHLVVEGLRGRVTILLMPGQRVERTRRIQSDELIGVLVPMGEEGTLAILGRPGEPFEPVEQNVRAAVRWEI